MKITNAEFINSVKNIYGDKYSFEKTNYSNARTNIIVTCVKHNHDFITKPQNINRDKHINFSVGSCPICMEEYTNKIKEKQLEKLFKSHNGIYKYKLDTYINLKKPMIAICEKHGDFEIIPFTHIKGGNSCLKCSETYQKNHIKYFYCDIHGDVIINKKRDKRSGCPICNNKMITNDKLKLLLNNKTSCNYNITFNDDVVIFNCKTHNTNKEYSKNFIKDNYKTKTFYCDDCFNIYNENKKNDRLNKTLEIINTYYFNIFTFIEFLTDDKIKLFNKITGIEKIYSVDAIRKKSLSNNVDIIYKNSIPFISYLEAKKIVNNLNITSYKEYKFWHKSTNQHSLPSNPHRVYKEFTTYYDFFNTNDLKYQSMSLGERKIFDFLNNKNIKFISEKTFPDCRDKALLRFDFYLIDYNCIIEFDGIQHDLETDYFRSSLVENQFKDNIKNE